MSDIDSIKYFMAAEKVENMINIVLGTLEFMDEFQIKPDEGVKKALEPVIEKMKKWIE